MELCSMWRLSTPPSYNPIFRFPLNNSTLFSGVVSQKIGRLRATKDDGSSDGYNNFKEERKDGVATLGDVPSIDNDVTLEKVSPVRQTLSDESRQPEPPQSDYSSSEEWTQPFQELLDNLNVKLDSEDSYKILLYGGGVLVAVWLLSAVVSSIDSIPVIPKLMEVVGLGYSGSPHAICFIRKAEKS